MTQIGHQQAGRPICLLGSFAGAGGNGRLVGFEATSLQLAGGFEYGVRNGANMRKNTLEVTKDV